MTEQEMSRDWRQLLLLLGVFQLQEMCHDKCAEEWRVKQQSCNENYEVGFPDWLACIKAAAEDHWRCINSCPPKKIPVELPWLE